MQEISWGNIQYFCEKCRIKRNLKLNLTLHDNLLIVSQNGLVTYSDTHRCFNSIYGVNNLEIDKDMNIRSIENLKLPEYRVQKTFSIPSPNSKTSSKNKKLIRITNLFGTKKIRLIMRDEGLNSEINIGRVVKKNEISINTLISDMGMIYLEFFPSDIEYSPNLEKWLSNLINVLEILPPTKLGILLETFKYIMDFHANEPTKFDINFIKTILASHEIFFTVADLEKFERFRTYNNNDFKKDEIDLMNALLQDLSKVPGISLQHFLDKYDKNLITLVYILLAMEQEQMLKIERPGIIEIDK